MKFKFAPEDTRLITVSPLVAAAIAEGFTTCFPAWKQMTTYEGPILLRCSTTNFSQTEIQKMLDKVQPRSNAWDLLHKMSDRSIRIPLGSVFAIANLESAEHRIMPSSIDDPTWTSRGAGIYSALGLWKVGHFAWSFTDITNLDAIACTRMGRGLQWAPPKVALAVQRQLGTSKIDLAEWIRKIEQKPLSANSLRVAIHLALNVAVYTKKIPNLYTRIGEYCLGPSYPNASQDVLRDYAVAAIDELIRARLIRDQGDGFALEECP